eukprot:403364220
MKVIEAFANGKLVSNMLEYSGQYLNNIGSYVFCTQNKDNIYFLQTIQTYIPVQPKNPSNPSFSQQDSVFSNDVVNPVYVVGNCIVKECTEDFLPYYDQIVQPTQLTNLILNNATYNYSNPDDDLQKIQANFRPGYIVMLCLLGFTLLLCLLGTIVQYSNFGNIKETKGPIKVHFTLVGMSEKDANKQQYVELLTQIDRLLLNRKKIWAVFFLCFSIPRNTLILFYDTEKKYKIGFMRILKVVGFIWICFDSCFYIGFKSYPVNFNQYPQLTTNISSTLMISGIIYGFSLVYFYAGFATMYEILQSIYLKQHKFNTLLFIFRCYIFYAIPVAFCTSLIVAVMPFLGSGPLYPTIMKQIFLDNCVSYWWTNLILISNYYPREFSSQCGNHLTYISNEFQMIAVFIPLFVFIYQKAYRKVLISSFVIIAVCGSLIPNFWMTMKYEINSYPGFLSNGYDYMFMKAYYRMPPFIIGIALAIIKFEYKFVGTLNDGSKPFHKPIIDHFKKNTTHKIFSQIIGLILAIFSVLILITNNKCVDKREIPLNELKQLDYCWSNLSSAFYNAFGQVIFFFGIILILLPSLVNSSVYLRPLMDSHLWHVLEELTFSAYILHYLVVVWFFASRQQDVILSMAYIFMVTISSCIFAYIGSVPFYLLVERPFRNFLDLILFPRSSIFKKQKDVEDEETDEDSDQDDLTDNDVNDDKMQIESQASSNNYQGSTFLSQTKGQGNPSEDNANYDKGERLTGAFRKTQSTPVLLSSCDYCRDNEFINVDCQCQCAKLQQTCFCIMKVSSNLNQKYDINRTLNSSKAASYINSIPGGNPSQGNSMNINIMNYTGMNTIQEGLHQKSSRESKFQTQNSKDSVFLPKQHQSHSLTQKLKSSITLDDGEQDKMIDNYQSIAKKAKDICSPNNLQSKLINKNQATNNLINLTKNNHKEHHHNSTTFKQLFSAKKIEALPFNLEKDNTHQQNAMHTEELQMIQSRESIGNKLLTIENVDYVESRSSLKTRKIQQRSGDLEKKRVSFDVHNFK